MINEEYKKILKKHSQRIIKRVCLYLMSLYVLMLIYSSTMIEGNIYKLVASLFSISSRTILFGTIALISFITIVSIIITKNDEKKINKIKNDFKNMIMENNPVITIQQEEFELERHCIDDPICLKEKKYVKRR